MSTPTHIENAAELHARLELLYVERALADVEGLSTNAHYMADLENEMAGTRNAYVGSAVTEIALLRAALSGPLEG